MSQGNQGADGAAAAAQRALQAPARPHAASGTQEDTDDHLEWELCPQVLSSRGASTSAWGGLQADPRVESVHAPDHLMG